MIGIYKIISPTNKVYIGQSWDIENRFKIYKNCSPHQVLLYRSLKKYGVDSHKFEVVHELPIDISQDILDNYEIYYWEKYRDLGFKMMNIKEPGKGGRHSEISKLLMSINQKESYSKNPDRQKSVKVEVYKYNLSGYFIKKYSSIREASRINGIQVGSICSCTSGKLKKAGSYIWRYYFKENIFIEDCKVKTLTLSDFGKLFNDVHK